MSEPRDINQKILPEDVERCKQQVGVPRPAHNLPYNVQTSFDAIRHFAFSCGDDNPLWHDPNHGAKSRWKGQIAPPMFFVSTGIGVAPRSTPETKALFKGLFKGINKYYTGVEWTWWRPLFRDDVVFDEHTTSDVTVREASSLTGSLTVTEVYRHLYMDIRGMPLACREESFINAERSGSRKTGRHNARQRQNYTPEDIARIDAVYAAEQRRGAEIRYWDDVAVGDKLTPVAKGPHSMVDVISYHMGQGLSHYGIGPLRYNWAQRQRMPGFYTEDRFGVPDVAQRVHWDADRAKDVGMPASYDYGQMRTNALAHLITNWMGDDGWLWKLSTQTRSFNFMGDTTICSGEIAEKFIVDGQHCVRIELQATNQLGENTAPGSATVILPVRDSWQSVLPAIPAEITARGAAASPLARQAFERLFGAGQTSHSI